MEVSLPHSHHLRRRCIDVQTSAVAVISDWALSTVPIAIIWNVQMSKRTKVGVGLLMGLGYLYATAVEICQR